MRSRIYSLTICFLFSVIHSVGQGRTGYLFRHITQFEGLLTNNVNNICQDKRGFIWIASMYGLQRYDGVRFVNYQDELNPGNKSLPNVSGCIAGDGNELLLSTPENIKKMDLPGNRISPFNQEDIRKDTAGKMVYKEGEHSFWILGNYCTYHYDDSLKKMSAYMYSLERDSIHHQTWAATFKGLLLFDDGSGKVYSVANNSIHDSLFRNIGTGMIKTIRIDSRHRLWIAFWTEYLCKYDLLTKKLTTYHLNAIRSKNGIRNAGGPLVVNAIFEDNHRQLWMPTLNGGLLSYNEEKGDFDCMRAEANDSRGLQYNYEIFCIFQDQDDNIWLGSDKGINIFNPYRQPFKIVRNEEGNENSLPKSQITSVIETRQGDILVGTWGGGVTVYDSRWNFRKQIRFARGPHEKNLIWSFVQRDDGNVWVGCQHGYIHVYRPSDATIIATIHPPALQNSTIRCMEKDKEGNILFGLHNGRVGVWNKRQNEFYAYNDSLQTAKITFSSIHRICLDAAGNCWVSTQTGLKRFDPERRAYTAEYLPGENGLTSCRGIEELNDSTLLVGFVNGGLSYFSKTTKKFSFPHTADKLLPSTVHAIRKDKSGNIWFTTDYNLYKFNTREKKYVSYNTEPGLINSSFELGSLYLLNNGKWTASTYSEVISFDPDSLEEQEANALPVAVTGLKVSDTAVFVDSFIPEHKPLELTFRQNFLTIEFATLRFSYIRQIKYYYRLSGIDKNWVDAGALRFARYTSLPPGRYVFEVMAEDGNIPSRAAPFQFVISPPFWRTWWFMTSVVAIVALAAWWLLRRRFRTIRREIALKQQIYDTEMKAIRAQMNPHFIFNSINSIDALIQSNDKYHATVYLNKFARLIRNILDSSKQNVVTLTKDLETLQLYIELEQFRNDYCFAAEIHTDPDLLQDDYRVPSLIIQPFVENAILHGLRYRKDNKGKLTISISRQNDYLAYVIQDNGVGRKASDHAPQKGKQSYGIQMSSDRIKLFNKEDIASIEITDLEENGQPAGTRVRLFLKTR
jgi:ligand-binding sensor domain-containing protein/two-component sensor histidine kinase